MFAKKGADVISLSFRNFSFFSTFNKDNIVRYFSFIRLTREFGFAEVGRFYTGVTEKRFLKPSGREFRLGEAEKRVRQKAGV